MRAGGRIREKKIIESGCNVEIFCEDLFGFREKFSGLVSLATINWINNRSDFLNHIAVAISPDWFALSGLFHDRNIDLSIEITEWDTREKSRRDIIGVPKFRQDLLKLGYELVSLEEFFPQNEILEPVDRNRMGSSTLTLINGKKLIVSGGTLQPWAFVFAKKKASVVGQGDKVHNVVGK